MANFNEGITFETLPKAVTHLTNEVSELKRLVLEIVKEQPPETDRWFDLNELCIYHPDKPTKQTVYGWVNNRSIPVYKGEGRKKHRFLKSEIDNWLKQGRKKTTAEIATEADQYLTQKKKR